MKDKYIDENGIDSLPNLVVAAQYRIPMFLTINKEMLEDKEELEKAFKIKIVNPLDMNNEL
jgi:hypothetical protein